MKANKILLVALLTIVSTFAYAAAPALGADSVLGTIQSSMAPAINKLTAQAMTWLAVLATLQLVLTNYAVLKSDGDIQMVIAKLAGSLIWVGFCIYIINNGPQFIGAVGDQMFGLLGLSLPSPGSIIGSTIGVVAALAALAVGVGGIGILGSTTAGMLLVYVLLFVLAIGMFFAFKIFMLKLELGLVVMLSPLSFAFLGLNSLKDQGIAPFKALISLTYRIILLTVILSAFTEVSNVASSALSGLSTESITDGIGEAIMTVLSALGAYMMLAYLVYKSDSIASSLAGGSTNMGTGDIASAAAAGAAAGAAVATGGASMAGTAAKAPQAMGNFMKSLAGGGSVSNASGMGTGSTQMGPSPSQLMSKSSGSGSSGTGAGAPMGGKSASMANNSPRPPSSAGTGVAQHASEGVAAAGGSQAASDAAATSAAAGGSNEDVAAAVVGAGGTEAQGAAAATAIAVGEAGGSASAIKAGAQAAGAGMSPGDVAHAVTHAVSPGSAFGATQEVGAAAARASSTKPTPSGGSGATGGIGGPGSATDQKFDKLMDHLAAQQGGNKKNWKDHLSNTNQHISQEKAPTHVSINTHNTD